MKHIHNETVINDIFNIKTDGIWKSNKTKNTLTLEHYLKSYDTQKSEKKAILIYEYSPYKSPIDLNQVKFFINFLYSIPTTKDGKNILPVFINLHDSIFVDKLVYILFETVIFHLIVDRNWAISVIGDFKSENCSNGIKTSSLSYGNWAYSKIVEANFDKTICTCQKIREEKYKYNRSESDGLSSTRFFVNSHSHHNDSEHISSDIYDFLQNSMALKKIDRVYLQQMAKAILEIKDNCSEHIHSPYIYDIDIKEVTHGTKSNLIGEKYVAVNVAIWDFSGVRLGDAIKKKVNTIESTLLTEKEYIEQFGAKANLFKKLICAKKVHTAFWNDNYDEDDFFALAAFQPGITGRPTTESTGGVGLPNVLDFLCDFPDNYKCYCLTGNTIINLDKSFLKKDEENWYSFADDKGADFTCNKPSNSCVSKSALFYPGTAFFLHLEFNGGIKQ